MSRARQWVALAVFSFVGVLAVMASPVRAQFLVLPPPVTQPQAPAPTTPVVSGCTEDGDADEQCGAQDNDVDDDEHEDEHEDGGDHDE